MTPGCRAVRVPMWAAAVLGIWLAPASARAQSPQEGRVHIGGGLLWIGPTALAEASAAEVTFGGQSRSVFRSEMTRDDSIGVVLRVSARIAPRIQVESAVTHNPGQISTELSGDAEAPAAVARESVTRDLFEAGIVFSPSHSHERRLAPFVTAGAGYSRLLHEGRTFGESGQTYYVGGGALYLLRSGGVGVREAGLRFDARAVVVRERISGVSAAHVTPAVGVSLLIGF